jgi:hypothetical protein
MPTVAKAPVNRVVAEGQVFEFTDGERQVSEAEQGLLRRWATEAGVHIYFEETKSKGGKK